MLYFFFINIFLYWDLYQRGWLAQLVERFLDVEKVVGSSPTLFTGLLSLAGRAIVL